MDWRDLVHRTRMRTSLTYGLGVRTPLYSPDFPAVVMWSEKAGCTVAVKWFLHHVGRLDEALAYHRWVHFFENDVFKAEPGYLEACTAAIRAGVPVIKFVRNPYTRIFSAFLETCRYRVLEAGDHWSVHTRREVTAYMFGDGADPAEPYTFMQFSDWLATRPVRTLDPHMAPQHLDVEARLNVQQIRLEDHGNAFLYAETLLGLPSTQGQAQIYNSDHHHAKQAVPEEEAAAVLETPLSLDRPPGTTVADPSAQVLATSRAGPTLRGLFDRDFSAYGYDRLA